MQQYFAAQVAAAEPLTTESISKHGKNKDDLGNTLHPGDKLLTFMLRTDLNEFHYNIDVLFVAESSLTQFETDYEFVNDYPTEQMVFRLKNV